MKDIKNHIEDGIVELELRSIRSLFETGDIRRMYDIAKLYPTKIVKALGFNYGRYIRKLAKPENFSIGEIVRFSYLIGVDPNKVIEIILKETAQSINTLTTSPKSILVNKKKGEISTRPKAHSKKPEEVIPRCPDILFTAFNSP